MSDRQQALAAGFQEHVPKPIDPITFIEVIRTIGASASGRLAFAAQREGHDALAGGKTRPGR